MAMSTDQQSVGIPARNAAAMNRQVEEDRLSQELSGDPDLFVTLKLGNIIFEEHNDRELTTINSRERGFDDDYEWLIARNQRTVTVRLRYCDALCLIETSEYLHQHDEEEFPSNIRGLARRFGESVRKQLKQQSLPCPIKTRY